MILSDRDILQAVKAGRIGIDPFNPDDVQPASLDIHLDQHVRIFGNMMARSIDVRRPVNLFSLITVEIDGPVALRPGEFMLGNTREAFTIADSIVAHLHGKSSLGRLGLAIHVTAGYIDPGFQGHLTLELFNSAPLPIILYAGMKIGQLSFEPLSSPALRPYGTTSLGSKYQGQALPTESLAYRDFSPRCSSTCSSIPDEDPLFPAAPSQ